MVCLIKALFGAALALTVVFTPALSAPSTTTSSTKGGATPTGNGTLIPTTSFILPTPAPAPTSPVPPNPAQQQNGGCPALMIPDPNPSNPVNGRVCVKGCCVRCPAINSFYEPGRVENVLKAAYFTRQASLGFAVFMAVSYLLLPGKRSQPHISVLFLTVSLTLWYSAFDIMPGYSNACANDLDQSTASNSRLCGVQGVLIIYLTQTSALWCSLLIYKLHLLAVWRSNWIDTHYGYFTAFCWIFPLAFAIPAAVKNLAEYPGVGFSCLVGTKNLNTYLFYPVAVYMYPAMVCHVITIAKMVRLAVMSSKIDTGLSQLSTDARMKVTTTMQAKRLLRGQWRPALMVGAVMTSLTIFWLFYFVDTHSLAKLGPETVWLQQWFMCIFKAGMEQKSADEMQTLCAIGARPNLPNIHWFTAAEILLALLGVVVAAVFITKIEFWEEWSFLLSNLFRRGNLGHGSRSSSGGSRSPDQYGNGSNSPTMVNRHPSTHSSNAAGEFARKGGPVPINRSASNGVHNDMHGNTGMFHQSSQSMSTKNLTSSNNSQWYDMDDLLDKEYEMQPTSTLPSLHHASSSQLQRNVSFSSRTGMLSNVSTGAIDPPKYSSNLTSPTRAHFTPSTSDRETPYTEKPVLPTPVPRTPRMNSNSLPNSQQQNIYLSSPTGATSPPNSPPTSYRTGTSNNNSHPLDSVPIVSVATRGSPAIAAYQTSPRTQQRAQAQMYQYQQQSQQPPTAQSLLYNRNEGSEEIMVASRESLGRAPSHINTSGFVVSPTIAPVSPTSPVSRTKSPPPSIPHKSPHRGGNTNQQVYMSPPIQLPSNNSHYYRE
ncbi:hypothetical protein FBU30_005789 [Linnemannia zychae]|nr:hypothetical protein FBU30_005789 [Linnemannia zychae]